MLFGIFTRSENFGTQLWGRSVSVYILLKWWPLGNSNFSICFYRFGTRRDCSLFFSVGVGHTDSFGRFVGVWIGVCIVNEGEGTILCLNCPSPCGSLSHVIGRMHVT